MRFFCPYKHVLRLRVVGASDSAADQARKLCVRDAVLAVFSKTPYRVASLRRAARAVDPTARVRCGLFRFGGYRSPAIQITLGQGAGHNWWGILYPAAVGISDEPVVFESFIIKLLRSWGWL